TSALTRHDGAIRRVSARKMHAIRRQLVFTQGAFAVEDDLELVALVIMRARDTSRIEECERRMRQTRAILAAQKRSLGYAARGILAISLTLDLVLLCFIECNRHHHINLRT